MTYATTLFRTKGRNGALPVSQLDRLIESLRSEQNDRGVAFASSQMTRAALALESIDSAVQIELNNTLDGLSTSLESIVAELGLAKELTQAQRDAANAAGMLSGDIAAALHQPIRHERVSTESVNYLSPETGEFFYERIQPALEAYDEKENRNAVVYMVAYNMMAARQDEFGEAFYPTVVVGNDQVGYTVSIRLIEISNDIRRPISGDASNNFNRRNIVQAVIYPDLLRNDITKVVPVVRDDSAKYFVDPALVAPYSVLLTDGSASNTAPLAIGKKFSLINISQTESTLDSGLMDITDALDTNVLLDAVYVSFTSGATTEVVKFRTSAMQRATFNFAVQGYYREMNLQFDSETLLVGPNTVLVDGGESTILAPIATQGYEARVGLDVFGKVVLETGDISLNASTVRLNSIKDTSDQSLDLTTGTGATLAALFDGATVIGYDIDARRTNSNRRQRGKLLNTNFFSQVYTVPLHAPITIPRPMQVGDVNDSSDLAALITATRIMTSNDAVDAIFRLRDLLAETTSALNTSPVPNSPLDTPAILGVSAFIIQPAYMYRELAVDSALDSLSAHQRAADVQASLVNEIRDMAYTLYVQSGYKAAADARAGGVAPVPTVVIGTDPYIARYLMTTGDLRTMGIAFDTKVVSTLNERMSGRIVLSFGDFSSETAGVPNPLHFGNMAWKPETTVVLPMVRNGAQSKELTVQPSYVHINNLAVLGMIDVSGITAAATSKVPVNMRTVA
jgi:hypothetical protein